jgi:hypothetical protein
MREAIKSSKEGEMIRFFDVLWKTKGKGRRETRRPATGTIALPKHGGGGSGDANELVDRFHGAMSACDHLLDRRHVQAEQGGGARIELGGPVSEPGAGPQR